MKKPNKPSACYVCATIDIFSIQVMLLVGDFEECCKLIEENRAKDYAGPKISDELRLAKKKVDKYSETRNGYKAFTAHVNPGIIIYAPNPITLATLVHEISHAVDYIFRITGADDGELRAYLCGYLFTELAAKDEKIIISPHSNKGIAV